MTNSNSYYDFSFDNFYNCKKVETAIKRAKEDIAKLNGEPEFLNFDDEYIKNHFKENNELKEIAIGSFVIQIEYFEFTEQWYINLKYKN